MEKIEVKEIKTTEKIHHFYCDKCGKDIGSFSEFDDGYYDEPKVFYIQHVKLKGHHCRECGTKKVEEVINFARSKGFDI